MKKHFPVHGVVLVFTFFVCLPVCYSQSVTAITDSTGLHAYVLERGDTATLLYDSAYILNKEIYKLYKTTYYKAIKNNSTWQELSDTYTHVIDKQDSLLKTKDYYYTLLRQSFDSLALNTNAFLNKSDNSLTTINQRIGNATSNLEDIKTSLDASLNKLKLQKKQKTQLLLGGFAVGAAIASLLFVVAK